MRVERGKKGSFPSLDVTGTLNTDLGISSSVGTESAAASVARAAGEFVRLTAPWRTDKFPNGKSTTAMSARRKRWNGELMLCNGIYDGLGLTRATMSSLKANFSPLSEALPA